MRTIDPIEQLFSRFSDNDRVSDDSEPESEVFGFLTLVDVDAVVLSQKAAEIDERLCDWAKTVLPLDIEPDKLALIIQSDPEALHLARKQLAI